MALKKLPEIKDMCDKFKQDLVTKIVNARERFTKEMSLTQSQLQELSVINKQTSTIKLKSQVVEDLFNLFFETIALIEKQGESHLNELSNSYRYPYEMYESLGNPDFLKGLVGDERKTMMDKTEYQVVEFEKLMHETHRIVAGNIDKQVLGFEKSLTALREEL